MRVYEVLFIVAPGTEEGDIENLITQFSDVITNQGARVSKIDRMGRRSLAYPINQHHEGYYVVLTVEGSGSEIAELERRMRVSDAVIRYLTVRVDEDLKRAEKIRGRRAAHAAAARQSGGRGRRSEPSLPIGRESNAASEEEE
jgi:small subunit ribosomal protein S6